MTTDKAVNESFAYNKEKLSLYMYVMMLLRAVAVILFPRYCNY